MSTHTDKWNVSDDIRQRIASYIKKLDYKLEYALDRCELVKKILEEDRDFLINYLDSPSFQDKQKKNKDSILAENDYSLMGLNIIADYLVFPKFKSPEEKQRHEIKMQKSNSRQKNKREIPVGDKTDISESIYNKNRQSGYRTSTKQTITQQDLNDFKELRQINEVLKVLEKILGYHLSSEERKLQEAFIVEVYGQSKLRKYKKLYSELKRDMIIIKERLRGTIYFKRLTKGTTNITFEEDTGYYDREDNYIEVSENRIDFSKKEHISALLTYYAELKQRFYDDIGSEMWAILFDLEQLIDKTKLRNYERDILIMKIDKTSNNEIIEHLATKYHMDVSDKYISKIFTDVIPRKIVNTYKQQREDWLFIYKVKGEYKKCSRCDENKLVKYFGKDNRNSDGLQSICKECDSYRKIGR